MLSTLRPVSACFGAVLTCAVVGAQEPQPSAIDFAATIKPLLEKHCFECHGGKRVEGELNLTSRATLFHEDEVMWAVIPSDVEGSVLVERIKLPAGDPDLMPEGGDPLPAEAIAALEQWIAAGAVWPDEVQLEGEAPPPVDVIEIPEMAEGTAQAVTQALAALAERGAVAQRVAQTTAAVDVNLSILGDKADDAMVAALKPLAPALVWLNLSRTAVTDDAMATVAALPHLRRLHLAKTGIGDAGLARLRDLTGLEFLNLYGTKTTDAGLRHLHGLTELRKLFLWQTEVTDEGVAALRKALPNLHVDRGDYLPQPAAPAAKPVNDKCPVTDKPLEPDTAAQFAVLHEGQWVGFCCAKCRAEFEADPKKFADKLPKVALAPLNDKCPVSGEAVDAKVTVEHEGRLVAFCCEKCKATFVADPAKFVGKLDAAPVLSPDLNDVCPVSNQPAKAQIFVDHDGLRIAFCCEKCQAKFVADPAKYLAGLQHPGKPARSKGDGK